MDPKKKVLEKNPPEEEKKKEIENADELACPTKANILGNRKEKGKKDHSRWSTGKL